LGLGVDALLSPDACHERRKKKEKGQKPELHTV